ncbi:MAG: hypothetical protein L0Z50_41035 [Verrucomicrobiales bacterium]|nr:hypothetical protein [Verrucomicrobiales bacterium]
MNRKCFRGLRRFWNSTASTTGAARLGVLLLIVLACLVCLLSDATRGGSSNLSPSRALSVSPPNLQPAILISNPPMWEAAGWRITWTSLPGRTYVLQRWAGRGLRDRREPLWTDLVTVRATGPTSFAHAHAASARADTENYYRVVELAKTAPQSEFTIHLESPVPLATGGWRITWSAVPGLNYTLQRWTTDDLRIIGSPAWTNIATLTATGPTAFADDLNSSSANQRFYRVMSSGAGPSPDLLPPSVSRLTVTETTLNGSDALKLSTTASDNVGVVEVIFFDGPTELGAATLTQGRWDLTIPLTAPLALTPHFFARATDAAKNHGFSPVFRFSRAEPKRFAVLDAAGKPTGEFAEAAPDGSLPAFEYRPAGRDALGASRDLSIKFSEGAKIVEIDGRDFIQFTVADVQFGADFPLQLITGDGPFQIASKSAALPRIRIAQVGETKLLPLGPLTAADLANALGYDPAAGIPVLLFNRFPLRWTGGTLEDYGIRGPVFALEGIGLPLPARSGEYREYVLNFLSEREVRLPFHGEFEIPDGTGNSARLRVPASRPIWLTLRADGRIALGGRVEVQFGNGASFLADVTLDDPFYRLEIAASAIQLPALVRLRDLLPGSFSLCLPAQANAALQDDAQRCLAGLADSLRQLNAGLLASMPFATAANAFAADSPTLFQGAASGALGAWASLTEHAAAQPLPLADLETLLADTVQRSTLDDSAVAPFERLLALQILAKSLGQGRVSGSAGTQAMLLNGLQSSLQGTLELLNDTDALSSLEQIGGLAELLAKLSENRAAIGPSGDALFNRSASLAQQLANAFASSLGLNNTAAVPDGFVTLATTDRAAVYEALSAAVRLGANLHALDDARPLPGPLPDVLSRLAARHFNLVSAALEAAAAANDLQGYALALEELAQLVSFRELEFFPSHVSTSALPDANSLVVRVQTLAALLPDAAAPPRSLVHQSAFLRRILNILNSLPANAAIDPLPFAALLAQLEPELAAGFAALSSNHHPAELANLLRAGSVQSLLARRLGLPSTGWESSRLPQLVQHLSEAAAQQEDWSGLHETVAGLLEFAAEAGDGGDSPLRRVYLQQIVPLLEASRSVAGRLIVQVDAARSGAPNLFAIDFQLPGGLTVHRVSGAASYNRVTRDFQGRFAGEVEFPEFGARLAIADGSLSGGGEFSIRAFGQIQFPFDDPIGRASISEEDPLFVEYTSAGGLRISGGAAFEFENGMFFKGSISLLDPIYQFSLEAGGLKFDLLESLSFELPALPAANAISEEGIGLFNALLETVRGGGSSSSANGLRAVALAQAGAPSSEPLFPGANAADPLTALEAWANYLAVEHYLGKPIDPAKTYEHVNRLIRQVGEARDQKFAEFQRYLESRPVGPALARAPPELRAIQFDFGTTQFPYEGTGPAHQCSASRYSGRKLS